jgi:streptogramin lyase
LPAALSAVVARISLLSVNCGPVWAAAGTVTEFNLPSGTAFDITAGLDGNLWFTEALSGEIGRVTPR